MMLAIVSTGEKGERHVSREIIYERLIREISQKYGAAVMLVIFKY